MATYKTANLVEKYKIKAKAKETNELMGRIVRPNLSRFVITQTISKIEVKSNRIIVDVGYGDG